MEKIVGGIRTEYTDSGEGSFVFLLHGWGSNKELFAPVIETASRKYRVIAPDLPGFGKSAEPSLPWSVGDYADWTAEFIKSFGAERVILLGHSLGGRITIKLSSAVAAPFEIEKIILVDSAGILPKHSAGYKMRVAGYKAVKKLLMLPPVKALFPDALENYRKKKGSADYGNASQVMRGSLVKIVNEDLEPLLPLIKAPTLLIWGERDDATPLSDGETMERAIPGAGLVKLHGAGHYSWLDSPYTFDAVIKSFLEI